MARSSGTDKLFDSIAGRYDIFNRISSFGFDIYWRRKLARSLEPLNNFKILDAACGTGDVLLALFDYAEISSAVGVDVSSERLALAQEKIKKRNLPEKIKLLRKDASDMPFPDFTFDAATCAFGVRNFVNPDLCLKQMLRVLKPAGRLLILEFSLPQNRLVKMLYLIYLKFFIPILGSLITGNFSAFQYLSETIQSFPSGQDFCRMLQNAGFANITAVPLTFGVVTLYSAQKPSA